MYEYVGKWVWLRIMAFILGAFYLSHVVLANTIWYVFLHMVLSAVYIIYFSFMYGGFWIGAGVLLVCWLIIKLSESLNLDEFIEKFNKRSMLDE